MFKIIKTFTLALSLFVTAVFVLPLIASDIPEISQQELLNVLNEPNNNIVLLDVRY